MLDLDSKEERQDGGKLTCQCLDSMYTCVGALFSPAISAQHWTPTNRQPFSMWMNSEALILNIYKPLKVDPT